MLQAQYFTIALFTLLYSIICIDLCTVVHLLFSLFLLLITCTNVWGSFVHTSYYIETDGNHSSSSSSSSHAALDIQFSFLGKRRSCTFTDNAWITWQISLAFINTFVSGEDQVNFTSCKTCRWPVFVGKGHCSYENATALFSHKLPLCFLVAKSSESNYCEGILADCFANRGALPLLCSWHIISLNNHLFF